MLWDLGCLLSTSFGINASATKKIISFVSFFDMFGNIRLWWQGKKHFITPLNITFLLSFHFEMPGHDLWSFLFSRPQKILHFSVKNWSFDYRRWSFSRPCAFALLAVLEQHIGWDLPKQFAQPQKLPILQISCVWSLS